LTAALLVLAPLRALAQQQQLTNPEAIQNALDAVNAAKEGNYEECVAKNKASLEKEDNPRTRLHLSGCEARIGKLLDSLKDAQDALQRGMKSNDEPMTRVARDRVLDLVKRLPKVTFIPPAGVTELKVTFDDRPVPNAALTKKFSIDPGKHVVKAEGASGGVLLNYEEQFDVKEGELLAVRITLKDASPGVLTAGQLRCMREAKTQEEVEKCLPQSVRTLVVRLGSDAAFYTDSTNVHVFTPSIRASFTSPTAGWNVGASYLVDFVTAASPDIVSTASRRYREQRHVVSLTGGYKPGVFGAQAYGNVSTEPDYLSLSAGGAIMLDLNDKLTTPRIGFTHSSDTIGRSDTPFEIWSKSFQTNEFEAGVTFVISPTTVLVTGATFGTERGDQSKPYRFVPTFQKDIAPQVPSGASPDLVNLYRLPMRPAEQLPVERDRYALAFRLNKRFLSMLTTLRLEERLYADTWAIKSSTTDARYMADLGRSIRVWPHGRLHAQTGANFQQLAYTGFISPQTGQVVVPTYRTTDRELSAMVTLTGGGGARLALNSPEAETQIGITVTGDAMYSQYFRSLYIRSRFAVYGALSLDIEF
jgi:hypothetical protein